MDTGRVSAHSRERTVQQRAIYSANFRVRWPCLPGQLLSPFPFLPAPPFWSLGTTCSSPDTLGFVWLWCLYAHCSLRLTSRSWLPGKHLLTCGSLPSSSSLSFLKLPEMELPCLHLPPLFPQSHLSPPHYCTLLFPLPSPEDRDSLL